MNRGEVWWGQPDGAKRRPYLVLTRSDALPLLTAVTCVPATTTIRGIASEVELDEDDGMPTACVLSLDNLGSVPKRSLMQPICTLGPERMQAVCVALGYATGCR